MAIPVLTERPSISAKGVLRDSEIVLVTPDLARKWLDIRSYSKQRRLRENRIREIIGWLERGEFLGGTIDFGATIEKPGWILLNGNHRLHGIVRANIAAQLNVTYSVVTTDDDLAQLYGTFDRPMVRSYADIIEAHGVFDSFDIPADWRQRLSSACDPILVGFQPRSSMAYELKSPEARTAVAREWVTWLPSYLACIAGMTRETRSIMRNGTILALGLVTLRYRPEHARDFWRSIALNDGLRHGTPEHSLLRWLWNREPKAYQPWEVARAVAACWNASYEGRSLKLVRIPPAVEPILIAGTPYNGRDIVIPACVRSALP